MVRFKGTIALDIDGTLTTRDHALGEGAAEYLKTLTEEGWDIIFLTGRTLSFARPLLSQFAFPSVCGVQNGAALYELPSEKLLRKHYLNTSAIEKIEPLVLKEGSYLLVESGTENGDVCFYSSHTISSEEREYLAFRMSLSPETWLDVPSLQALPFKEFALGKFYVQKEKAEEIAQKIRTLGYVTMVLRDPFREGGHLGHITAKGATKGNCLAEFLASHKKKGAVIAAGDDINDLEMLKLADYKIVMEHAPSEVIMVADFITQQGKLLPTLQEAVRRC